MLRLASIVLVLVGCFLAGGAAAQSARETHDLWHPVYETWQRPDGRGSCCNKHDCRPVAYRQNGSGVEIRIDELGGTWHAVPPRTILPFASFNTEAHACYLLERCVKDLRIQPCLPDIRCVALPMSM